MTMDARGLGFPSEQAIRDAELVFQGYTVSARGKCMTRLHDNYVLRDGARHCVRLPVADTDAVMLGAAWAGLGRPTDAASAGRETTQAVPVSVRDTALVLHGYTASNRDVCLARIVGNYVTRDGVRRCVRLLVDAVDPVTLGAAWSAFSEAAGWRVADPVVSAGLVYRSAQQAAGREEKRRATG